MDSVDAGSSKEKDNNKKKKNEESISGTKAEKKKGTHFKKGSERKKKKEEGCRGGRVQRKMKKKKKALFAGCLSSLYSTPLRCTVKKKKERCNRQRSAREEYSKEQKTVKRKKELQLGRREKKTVNTIYTNTQIHMHSKKKSEKRTIVGFWQEVYCVASTYINAQRLELRVRRQKKKTTSKKRRQLKSVFSFLFFLNYYTILCYYIKEEQNVKKKKR